MNNTSLELSPDEMRSLGYRAIDILIDHLTTLRDQPVTGRERRPAAPIRPEGQPVDAVLEHLMRDILSNIGHPDHPRFLAFVPSPSNFVSIIADTLASGFNVFAGNWLEGAGAAQVELVTIDWLRKLCGLPSTGGGLFVSGGSMANLTALAAARTVKCDEDFSRSVLYCSEQTHSSLAKGLRVLGFRRSQLRSIAVDAGHRISIGHLLGAIQQDRAGGLAPWCVVANAGATNTGAVDPLPELADICAREALWLHADGSYGAAALLTEEGRAALRGIERADSISLDPHKWFFQPFEIGCVLVRDHNHLRETFRNSAEYLKDAESSEEQEFNYYDYGIQLTRGFRALKLWMSLQVFGANSFRDAIERGLEAARTAEGILREKPVWEIVTPAQLGVITFRYRPANLTAEQVDAINRSIVAHMLEDGYALVTSTEIAGRTVLRLCPINPRLTTGELRETIARLERFGRDETC